MKRLTFIIDLECERCGREATIVKRDRATEKRPMISEEDLDGWRLTRPDGGRAILCEPCHHYAVEDDARSWEDAVRASRSSSCSS